MFASSVSAPLCVHARAARARQTFPISVLRFEKRGRKSQSSSYYSSLKANGEEAVEEYGGREGCREEERESQTGGMKGGWGDILTLISQYLVFCIPGCALSLSPFRTPFLPFLPRRFSEYRAQGCVFFASACGGWYAVHPNISYSGFCFLEHVSSSDTKRQDAVFQLSSLFVCKPFFS